jgi:hypothetical protein
VRKPVEIILKKNGINLGLFALNVVIQSIIGLRVDGATSVKDVVVAHPFVAEL